MKQIIPLALLVASLGAVAQEHYVNPYYRSDGSYVQGHHQTNPDSSRANNWTALGNANPYTGQPGKLDPYEIQRQHTPMTQQQQYMPQYPQLPGLPQLPRIPPY